MICGPFSESQALRLELEDVEVNAYSDILNLWCGKEGLEDKTLDAIMAMASVADRLEMKEVATALEDTIIGHLSVAVCGDVLIGSTRLGLQRVEASARGLALEHFEEIAETEGFMRMDETAVGSLLDDDALNVSREEAALEAVVRWMKGEAGGELRGRGLLGKIRFCLFDPEYLAADAHQLLPADHVDWIDGLVLEAFRINAAGHRRGSLRAGLLEGKSDVRREGSQLDVRWERYTAGGERRLQLEGHADQVYFLAGCKEWVYSGLMDGSIRVSQWDGATLQHQRTLRDKDDEEDPVSSLAAWNGYLISGHSSSMLRVWNMGTGVCDQELEGHTGEVCCLAVAGTRLVSGSDSVDKSIKVWQMGTSVLWPCERTLLGHDDRVNILLIWQDKVLSSSDCSVCVWNIGTGADEAKLTGHVDEVCALAVHRNRLFSASYDGTIREWALGTWVALRTVEAYGMGARQIPQSLVVSGSKLICGSADRVDTDAVQQYEVRVWDLGTLKCEHTMLQPEGSEVFGLAALGDLVWGCVGKEVVVWGLPVSDVNDRGTDRIAQEQQCRLIAVIIGVCVTCAAIFVQVAGSCWRCT